MIEKRLKDLIERFIDNISKNEKANANEKLIFLLAGLTFIALAEALNEDNAKTISFLLNELYQNSKKGGDLK